MVIGTYFCDPATQHLLDVSCSGKKYYGNYQQDMLGWIILDAIFVLKLFQGHFTFRLTVKRQTGNVERERDVTRNKGHRLELNQWRCVYVAYTGTLQPPWCSLQAFKWFQHVVVSALYEHFDNVPFVFFLTLFPHLPPLRIMLSIFISR